MGGAAFAAPLHGLAAAVERTPQSSSPSELRITGVRGGLIRGQHSLFVKVETNQGIHGCAEAVDGVYGTYYVMKHIAERHLIGRNPLDVHRLQEEMRRGGLFKGAQAGMYVAVMSALETALWDLVGKALGLPVYQLLGGKFRDKIRVYCDTAGSRLPPEEMGRRAKEDVEKYGFTAVKFDIDDAADPRKLDRYNWSVSLPELERMVAQIAAVRAAVGPHVDICVDCHGRFDEASGHKIAKAMEPFNLMWLEEPVPAEFPEAYARIRQETTTPICGGENWYLTYGFRRPLEIGACDVIMPDLQKAGGLGEGQRIANLANTYNVPFAPHMVASYLGAMASAHVCASVPNFLILEWQIYFHTDKMFQEIVTFDGPMLTADGHIPLRDARHRRRDRRGRAPEVRGEGRAVLRVADRALRQDASHAIVIFVVPEALRVRARERRPPSTTRRLAWRPRRTGSARRAHGGTDQTRPPAPEGAAHARAVRSGRASDVRRQSVTAPEPGLVPGCDVRLAAGDARACGPLRRRSRRRRTPSGWTTSCWRSPPEPEASRVRSAPPGQEHDADRVDGSQLPGRPAATSVVSEAHVRRRLVTGLAHPGRQSSPGARVASMP